MTFKRLATAAALALAALVTSVSAGAAAPSAAKPAHVAPAAPSESKATTAKPVAAPEPPSPPEERSPESGRVGIGDDVVVKAGEVFDGDVSCVRGHVTIDGRVHGDVAVVAGTLDISGTVTGDVVAIVSNVRIAPGATIEGQLVNVGGSLSREDAKVRGETVNIPLGVNLGPWTGWRGIFGGFAGFFFWWKLFGLLLFFVCALLMTALVPDRIRLISEETPLRFFHALVLGLLGYVLFGIVQFFLAVTVIGLPLVLLLYVVFVVLKWMAMCGMFHYIGLRMGRGLGREMSLLGAIVLGFLPFAFLRFLPFCIGWTIWFAVEIVGFGYLIVTRVGVRRAGEISLPAPTPPQPTMTS